jgi:hypothetical protein
LRGLAHKGETSEKTEMMPSLYLFLGNNLFYFSPIPFIYVRVEVRRPTSLLTLLKKQAVDIPLLAAEFLMPKESELFHHHHQKKDGSQIVPVAYFNSRCRINKRIRLQKA